MPDPPRGRFGVLAGARAVAESSNASGVMWAMEDEMFVLVRRTEHVEVTSRAVAVAPARESAAPGPTTVRVFCDDYDATDSSGDDDDAVALAGGASFTARSRRISCT